MVGKTRTVIDGATIRVGQTRVFHRSHQHPAGRKAFSINMLLGSRDIGKTVLSFVSVMSSLTADPLVDVQIVIAVFGDQNKGKSI